MPESVIFDPFTKSGKLAPTPEPQRIPGRVILWSEEADFAIVARHYELPQDTTASEAGWREVPRPGRRPITTWDGPPSAKLTLTLLVDVPGLLESAATNVETPLANLRSLRLAGPDLDRPARVRVIGKAPMADDVDWWIADSIAITRERFTRTGRCSQARVVLELTEYLPSVVHNKPKKKSSGVRHYVWRRGDSLHALAKKYSTSTKAIRRANPGKKHFTQVPAGTKINIPPKES